VATTNRTIPHALAEHFGVSYEAAVEAWDQVQVDADPIPMHLVCPECGERHIDEGEFATKPHHTHACQHCGLTWRPAVVPTVGVRFLPGFKNGSAQP